MPQAPRLPPPATDVCSAPYTRTGRTRHWRRRRRGLRPGVLFAQLDAVRSSGTHLPAVSPWLSRRNPLTSESTRPPLVGHKRQFRQRFYGLDWHTLTSPGRICKGQDIPGGEISLLGGCQVVPSELGRSFDLFSPSNPFDDLCGLILACGTFQGAPPSSLKVTWDKKMSHGGAVAKRTGCGQCASLLGRLNPMRRVMDRARTRN